LVDDLPIKDQQFLASRHVRCASLASGAQCAQLKNTVHRYRDIESADQLLGAQRVGALKLLNGYGSIAADTIS
jgi:hypothetical protein